MEETPQRRADDHNKIKKVLQNEIAQIVAIVAVVYSFIAFVIFPIKSIEYDINNIKSNHLHTIEQSMGELKTLQESETKENSAEHQIITKQLERTATILDMHLKNMDK